jgi:predicted outer membrane repeat protein
MLNHAIEEGGAYGSSGSSVGFRNCSFVQNTAREAGGAVMAAVSKSVIFSLSECQFK